MEQKQDEMQDFGANASDQVFVECRQTEDGSPTLYNMVLGEHYHSVHGAIQESRHIFLQAGLLHWVGGQSRELTIYEVGFGTGLNALLTYCEIERLGLSCIYHTVERWPVPLAVAESLNYCLDADSEVVAGQVLSALHRAPWGRASLLSKYFTLYKVQADLLDYAPPSGIDIVYFDAFSPEVQPSLWDEEVFRRIYEAMNAGGVLTTYCAKGEVRRRLQRVGFLVERLPGPKGKREILRATK